MTETRTVDDGNNRTVNSIEATDWKSGYITQQYMKKLRDRVKQIETQIGMGKFLNRDSAETTLANTAFEIGKIKGLNLAIEIIDEITL